MADEKEWELAAILREMHNITGFRFSLHDTGFRELAAYPAQGARYCRCVQQSREGLHRCRENDREAFERVKKHPKVYTYLCCFGLCEAVAPLYIRGTLTGYLMMGQAIDGQPGSREKLLQNGADYAEDLRMLKLAVKEVPVCGRDKIVSCLKVLDICAQYITLSHLLDGGCADVSEQVKAYLERHYAERITLESLCLRFFQSRTGLTAAFKKRYGTGVIETLTEIRMNAAKDLLRSTTLPIKDVAANCGYSDQNYFCKVVNKRWGKTPTRIRSE